MHVKDFILSASVLSFLGAEHIFQRKKYELHNDDLLLLKVALSFLKQEEPSWNIKI